MEIDRKILGYAMRLNLILITGLITIMILLILGFVGLWLSFPEKPYGHYRKEITRVFDSSEDEQALLVAENELNYSHITGLERLNYSWANYIDNVTLQFYIDEFEDLRAKNAEHNVYLSYSAHTSYYDKISVSWKDNKIIVWESGRQAYTARCYGQELGYEYAPVIKFYDGSDFVVFDLASNITINECYLVAMRLTYSNSWGPLAAYYVHTTQFIILDKDYSPVFVYVDPSDHVVS